VKRLRSKGEAIEFQLEPWEGVMLAAILDRYPCLPPAHQPLSKGRQVPDALADQRLLDEALAEQRQENQQQLDRLLADSKRFRESKAGWRLSLAPGDLEWLLQVLNDLRIGSWVKLGSPEAPYGRPNERTAPDLELMELSGYFQMELLAGLNSPSPPGTPKP
jgi:hypothetical protein